MRAGGRGRSLGDIFFLNSFAEDYSSAITALTKRETAQNREEGGEVCRRDCLSTFRMGILRRAPRDFDEKQEKGKEGEGERDRKRKGKGGIGGPFELLMREKLPRLLSINFSNYVAEDVPPEENRLPPTLSFTLSTSCVPLPFLLSSSLSLISFAG